MGIEEHELMYMKLPQLYSKPIRRDKTQKVDRMYDAWKVEVQVYQGNEGKGRKAVDVDI